VRTSRLVPTGDRCIPGPVPLREYLTVISTLSLEDIAGGTGSIELHDPALGSLLQREKGAFGAISASEGSVPPRDQSLRISVSGG
jgi:hypothetical protein